MGLLLDSECQIVCVPAEKVSKALDMIDFFLDKNRKKATLLQLQQLCGYLNFFCKVYSSGQSLPDAAVFTDHWSKIETPPSYTY